jgi:hypothetical protein
MHPPYPEAQTFHVEGALCMIVMPPFPIGGTDGGWGVVPPG